MGVVAKEDMEVAIATEEVDTEVEAAVVTIENHPMVSLWYCTQLPFYDIYYVSCFNTCENVTKLLHHFNSLTTKIQKQNNYLSTIILPIALAPSHETNYNLQHYESSIC